MQKKVFFVLVFVLPISIFLFLRMFGRNEFDVEPLFQEEFPEEFSECRQQLLPYHVPDSILTAMGWTDHDSLTLLYWGRSTPETSLHFERISDRTANESLRVIYLFDSVLVRRTKFKDERFSFRSPTSMSSKWRRCAFFLTDDVDLVMVDSYRRIRGQYKADSREEIDRLLTEIAILRKRY